MLSVGLEPACSTRFESRVVAGLCESSVWLWSMAVAGRFPWQECPCGEPAPGRRMPSWEHRVCPAALVPGAPQCSIGIAGCSWRSPSVLRPVNWGARRALGGTGSCF